MKGHSGGRILPGMIWTVPNMLTMARVAAAPLVAILFITVSRPVADLLAFLLFTSAALTDFIDGFLARRWHQQTPLGKMLDPIADKAMVIIALAVLLGLNSLAEDVGGYIEGLRWELVIPMAVILMREILISGLREHLGAIKIHVTPLAKWKTTIQMVAIGIGFLQGASEVLAYLFGTGPGPISGGLWALFLALLWIAAGLTAITGIDYFAKGVPHLRRQEGG